MIHIYYKAPKSSTPSPRPPGEGGFTLLEMLVVISVVGIMMAISLPIINTTLINMHVASAASSLSGAVQTARYQAISTGCPVQFTTIPASNSYQLATEVVSWLASGLCQHLYQRWQPGTLCQLGCARAIGDIPAQSRRNRHQHQRGHRAGQLQHASHKRKHQQDRHGQWSRKCHDHHAVAAAACAASPLSRC